MPNHITNIVTFEGEETKVKEIVDYLNTKDGPDEQQFDFAKIIPVEDKNDSSGWAQVDEHRKKWGTKWNSYDLSFKDNVFTFDTAWSTPFLVIERLSQIFPDVLIKVKYADEDIGSNCGWYDLKNGIELGGHHYNWIQNVGSDGNAESIFFACEVKGWSTKDIDENFDGLWTRVNRLKKLDQVNED